MCDSSNTNTGLMQSSNMAQCEILEFVEYCQRLTYGIDVNAVAQELSGWS